MREPRRYDWRVDVRARLDGVPLTPEAEAQVIEEVALHLEEQYEELSMREDPHTARERLLAQLREQSFDHVASGKRRGGSFARRIGLRFEAAGGMRRDVAHAVRSLLRNPGVAIPGVVALALGIGLTSAMFSVVYSTLLRGLPYRASDRIAMVNQVEPTRPGDEQDAISLPDFDAYRARQQSFELFGAYYLGSANVSGGDRPDRLASARVTPDAMDLTSVRPILGRPLSTRDDAIDAPLVALIGYQTWRDRFAGDSGIIGKTIRVNDRIHRIVGVMPPGFSYPNQVELWMPLRVDRSSPGAAMTTVMTVGRLRRGVGIPAANADLRTIAEGRAAERTESSTHTMRPLVQTFVRNTIRSQVYAILYAMLGAVGLVLIVACANVANLLLHRAADRTKEIGVLSALGASRGAIIRRALVESGLLALVGAALGVGLAAAFIRVYNHALPASERPFWMSIQLYPPVLAFAVAIAIVSGLVAGVLPAMQSARIDVAAILKDDVFGVSALRMGRLSRGVIVAEIAVASAMLLAAGFITKSIVQLTHIEPGFRTEGIVTARVTLATPDTVRRARFFDDLDRALASMRGVSNFDVATGIPGTGWNGGAIEVEGRVYTREGRRPGVRSLAVTNGFFSTYGVKTRRGRAIAATDRADREPIAVVSEALVRRVFRDVDPIGKRVRFASDENTPSPWLTIVGVMPTLYAATMDNAPYPPEVLTSFWQERNPSSATIAIDGSDDVIASLRTAIAALDPELPLYDVRSVDAQLTQAAWPMRLFGGTFVMFGVASIVLAAIGLYAVIAFAVSRRTREFGIRLALGATRADVVRMICTQASVTIGIGVAIGLTLGAMLTRALSSVLFGVSPSDPIVFASVGGVLAAVAFVACVVPANRATRLDPVVALRSD
ncbi:MAG TPA: ABC transporter permease [Gemmatimonadaceae bacterium]|jgi:predicted permease